MTYTIQPLNGQSLTDFRDHINPKTTKVLRGSVLDNALREFLRQGPKRHLYVVDDEDRLLGAVRFSSVVKVLFPSEPTSKANDRCLQMSQRLRFAVHVVNDLIDSYPSPLHETDTLSDFVQQVILTGEETAPVVDASNHLLGEISLCDVLRAYMKKRSSQDAS